LCGAVRFEIEMPTLFCGHCHCSMCRRSHGAGFVTWTAVPNDRFRLLSGEDKLTRYRSSEHGTRSFCGVCGSSMFCEIATHGAIIDIALATVDGDIDRQPEEHIFFDDRVAWVPIADDLRKLGGQSGLEPL
jgi:hypothetical protein